MYSYRGLGNWDDKEKLPFGFDYLFSLTKLFDRVDHLFALPDGFENFDLFLQFAKDFCASYSSKIERMFNDPYSSRFLEDGIRQRFYNFFNLKAVPLPPKYPHLF